MKPRRVVSVAEYIVCETRALGNCVVYTVQAAEQLLAVIHAQACEE